MTYCRINLSKTNYNLLDCAKVIVSKKENFDKLITIYRDYCRYKQFTSVMPIFLSEVMDTDTDIIGYYDNNQLVAWSLLKRFDTQSVECVQFSWNYLTPKLRLGIRSIEHECAYYKQLGFEYLYLGETSEYKCQFDGYEELGPI
jgi:hypothetical protein